jgi:hypothetical protein
MSHVCRRSVRNGPERGGTGGDAAGYRLPSIPGGYEVRARFCWEFRTARRGFDSRRLQYYAARSSSAAASTSATTVRTSSGVVRWFTKQARRTNRPNSVALER